ncbi:hypothetical protein AVEN_96441-1, partial [Araneus ventricosus]
MVSALDIKTVDLPQILDPVGQKREVQNAYWIRLTTGR